MTFIVLLLLFVAFLPVGARARDRIVEEQKFQSQLTRTILIAPEEFTAEAMDRRFSAFMAEVADHFRVARLELYPGPDDPRGPNCKCSEPVSYGFWGVLYEKLGGRLPASAELLIINGAAAVRVRDANGLIKTRVLRGPDPYLLHIGDAELRLVHVDIGNGPRVHEVDSGAMLRCYFMTSDSLGEALGRAAIAEIQRTTSTRNIGVAIRHDPWFIKDSDFPVVPPYTPLIRPPSREEYEKGDQVSCTDSALVTGCVSTGAGGRSFRR